MLGKELWKPEFIYTSNNKGKIRFDILSKTPGVQVYDQIKNQLEELIKLLHPAKKFSKEELRETALKHLNGTPEFEYGVWVFYPWSNRLVHLLDEEEFVKARTNRNIHKITEEEQKALSQKKIGLIGLSVGQSAALTMAIERCFGELRIADFDHLEITNLNRIRTGTHNLGTLKTTIVAREIMEIDPFLNLKCFSQGVTKDNIDEFLLEGGKLDLLIDECDSLDIKVLSRYKAKEYKIPVIMETSDRGMIDIERFDLEKDRPIFHGLTEQLSLEESENLNAPEEKISFVLQILDEQNLSPKMRLSISEIGKSISTWPQLASAIALGGGIATDTARRILLNEAIPSGRSYIDIENIIKND